MRVVDKRMKLPEASPQNRHQLLHLPGLCAVSTGIPNVGMAPQSKPHMCIHQDYYYP